MKKLAAIALTVAALSFTFNFLSCSGGSGSGSGSTGTESGTTPTQNALLGKTFVSYVLESNYSSASSNKVTAVVATLHFNNTSQVTMTQLKSRIKNGTVKENLNRSGENCTYSISGSTVTIGTSEGDAIFNLSSNGRTLSGNEGNFTLAEGNVYARTETTVSSNKSKARIVIVILGSGGNGHYTEKRRKNGGSITNDEDCDFNYTISGTNFALTTADNFSATGSLSSDANNLTVNWEEDETETYTKL